MRDVDEQGPTLAQVSGHATPERVREVLGEAFGAPAVRDRIQVRGPLHAGRYSTIFRADVDGHAVAVKFFVDAVSGNPDTEAARSQFHALQAVYAAMGAHARARVPRPDRLVQEAGAIVIEWIDGQVVTHSLMSPGLSHDDAVRLMQRCGEWLRCFAGVHPLPPRPLAVESKLAGVASMERDELRGQPAAAVAAAALRRHAAAVAGVPLDHSWLHGDFKADNVLWNRDTVVAIDVHARHENAIAHDAAAFANHWRLMLCDPRAWRWAAWARELREAFVSSVDPRLLDEHRLPFAWIALHVMLGNWCEFLRRRRPGLKHAYLQAMFDRIVRRMTLELDAAAGAAREQRAQRP